MDGWMDGWIGCSSVMLHRVFRQFRFAQYLTCCECGLLEDSRLSSHIKHEQPVRVSSHVKRTNMHSIIICKTYKHAHTQHEQHHHMLNITAYWWSSFLPTPTPLPQARRRARSRASWRLTRSSGPGPSCPTGEGRRQTTSSGFGVRVPCYHSRFRKAYA